MLVIALCSIRHISLAGDTSTAGSPERTVQSRTECTGNLVIRLAAWVRASERCKPDYYLIGHSVDAQFLSQHSGVRSAGLSSCSSHSYQRSALPTYVQGKLPYGANKRLEMMMTPL